MKFPFKLNDIVTYIDENLHGTYRVISLNKKDFWLQSQVFENMFFKYNPEEMKII